MTQTQFIHQMKLHMQDAKQGFVRDIDEKLTDIYRAVYQEAYLQGYRDEKSTAHTLDLYEKTKETLERTGRG